MFEQDDEPKAAGVRIHAYTSLSRSCSGVEFFALSHPYLFEQQVKLNLDALACAMSSMHSNGSHSMSKLNLFEPK